MRVTDAVVHVWEVNKDGQTAAKQDGGTSQPPFTLERLQAAMAEAEVDRVVLVPPRSTEVDTASANDYAFKAARLHPKRFVVMARIDPERPAAPAQLDEWMTRPGMKGLRLNLKWEPLDAMDWIWPEAIRRDMPIYMLAMRGRLPSFIPVIERNPDLRVLLDHAALPAEGPDPWADLDTVVGLARHKNVVVKLSGLTRYSKQPYPFTDIHPHIRRLYDAYGPQRLAWGSDYSLEAHRIPYRQVVDLYREACDFFTESDREWILDKTLSRVLNWDD